MSKKFLILLLIICAGNIFKLSANYNLYADHPDFPGTSGLPYGVIDDRYSKPLNDNDELANHLAEYNLPIPEPYKDFQIDLLIDRNPLPPYFSIDGVYKIDCVYIKGFNYFELWETNKLNPYGFNGEHYYDSLKIELFGNDSSNDRGVKGVAIDSGSSSRRQRLYS